MSDLMAGTALVDWVRVFGDRAAEAEAELTALDRAIGDADHGSNLVRGLRAAGTALDELDADVALADALKKVGMSLVSTVGGASGPLYGTWFLRLSAALPDQPVTADLDSDAVLAGLRAGLDGVVARGKTELDDKTMVDALTPAVDAWHQTDGDLASRARAAATPAEQGRDHTEGLVARKGRASYLGERSAGHVDPGAASAALMMAALAEAVEASAG